MGPDLLGFTAILALTTIIVLVLRLLKQPSIIAYIVAGLLVGPAALDIVSQVSFLSTFSSIGIAFLLFLVGINLDLRTVRRIGPSALLLGIGQIALSLILGLGAAWAIGVRGAESWYVAAAVTFSSTIVVVKLLSDKKDLDSLSGQLAVAVLVIQDLVAVIALSVVAAVGSHGASSLLAVLGKAIALGVVALLTSKYILPPLLHAAGKNQETLFLFSITWCFVLATLFWSVGLSLEIGALVAGLLLASTPYSYEISSRIKPLRDFFIILFFVVLGAQMHLVNIENVLVPAIILSGILLLGKPLIIAFLMGLLGFSKRSAYHTGGTLAQASEFSLILASLGASFGHVAPRTMTTLVLTALLTITGSAYFMTRNTKLFRRIGRFLPYVQRGTHHREPRRSHKGEHEVIIFGCDRVGSAVVEHFHKSGKPFLVVDYNPDIVLSLQERGDEALFGDADDVELYEDIGLERAKLVISTITEPDTSELLLRQARLRNKDAYVILTASQPEDALALYEHGADYVIIPHIVGGDHAAVMLDLLFNDMNGFLRKKQTHVAQLRARKRT